ncbi:MAG: hypothetical protein H6621_05130 [Halobacteriovoraceae bacterium]|nr:hypothetical protein [Halobacteriovoraceae bacterium]
MFKFYILFVIFIGNSWAVSKLDLYKKNINFAYKMGFRYAVVPWVKEYIYFAKGDTGAINTELEKLVIRAGAKNFEGLDLRLLQSSRGSVFHYLSGKKLFSKGQYSQAKDEFNKISANSIFFSMGLNFVAVIEYLNKNYSSSFNNYSTCIDSGTREMNNYIDDEVTYKQLKINRDLCLAGKARSHYAMRNLNEAESLYQDLDKASIVWPSILLEEAWASFYKKDFNRTLGKLVTYNAPLLRYNTNPEIYVLRAMTFLRMCLYRDVSYVVDEFYKKYEKLAESLEITLNKYTKSRIYYYNMLLSYKDFPDKSMVYELQGIYKSPNVKSFIENIEAAELEKKKVYSINGGAIKRSLLLNLNEFITTQKTVIGVIVRNKLKKYAYDLRKAFQAMSYMKLEVLGRKKEALYAGRSFEGKRGDVSYLNRTSKQYFWDFIGEFWADELGDYVFTLPTECN